MIVPVKIQQITNFVDLLVCDSFAVEFYMRTRVLYTVSQDTQSTYVRYLLNFDEVKAMDFTDLDVEVAFIEKEPCFEYTNP